MKKCQVPKEGHIYKTFDDGKINLSRMYDIEIDKVIPFNEISKKILKQWKKEVKSIYWLYNKQTDYFVIAKPDEDNSVEIFVRTIDNNWFSFSDTFLTYSRLDVNGDLYKKIVRIK